MVIVIIGMLVAMLMPAVLRSRENARRAKCMNNQRGIAQAAQAYEAGSGHLPGVINALGSVTPGVTWPLSWAAVLLPNMGRDDAWANWKLYMNGQPPANTNLWTGNLPQMVCPSTDVLSAGLNYVVNCGSSDPKVTNVTFNGLQGNSPNVGQNLLGSVNEFYAGVFLDYYNPALQATGTNTTSMPRVTTSNIKDGAAMTLMLSENLQAGNWMGGLGNTPNGNTNMVQWGSPLPGTVAYNLVGMFWTATGPSTATGLAINVDATNANYPNANAADYSHARPRAITRVWWW